MSNQHSITTCSEKDIVSREQRLAKATAEVEAARKLLVQERARHYVITYSTYTRRQDTQLSLLKSELQQAKDEIAQQKRCPFPFFLCT